MEARPALPDEQRAACVVVAAGDSTRMGGHSALGSRKPLVALDGCPVIEHTLTALDRAERVAEVIVVAHADDVRTLERWCAERPAFAKVVAVVPGGATRTESVRRGVFWCQFALGVLCVHDAARPLVSPELVDRAVEVAARNGAALVAVPAADTIKHSDDGQRADATLDRRALWCAQTPQCFEARRFRSLLARAEAEDFHPTDDAALWERYEGGVPLVQGSRTNLKITTPEDLELAHLLLARRAATPAEPSEDSA